MSDPSQIADYGDTLKQSSESCLVLSMRHDWKAVTVTRNGRKRHGHHCGRCYVRALCPHGCGFLQWCDDEWYCPKCGDEWHDEETFDSCVPPSGSMLNRPSHNGSSAVGE